MSCTLNVFDGQQISVVLAVRRVLFSIPRHGTLALVPIQYKSESAVYEHTSLL